MTDELEGWSPVQKTSFTDEQIVWALAATRGKPEERVGNLWTFFSNLPAPERERLEGEATKANV